MTTRERLEEIQEGQKEIIKLINELKQLHGPDYYKYHTYSILDVRQAADFLNIPQTILLEACLNREIPCRRIATTYIFQRDQLITWLNTDEPKADVKECIDTATAADLLSVPPQKVREWAANWSYYGMPIIRKGTRVYYPKELLIEWAETPVFNKLKETYLTNSAIRKQRLKEAEERREVERMEQEAIREAKRKARLEKLLSIDKTEKK